MAILPLRDLAPAANIKMTKEGEFLPVSFIQEWRKHLFDFFFGDNGILLNQRVGCIPKKICPIVMVYDGFPRNVFPGEFIHVGIMVDSSDLERRESVEMHLKKQDLQVESLMTMARKYDGENNILVCSKIGGNYLNKISLRKTAFVQLVASLLYLSNDICKYCFWTIEDEKRQQLERAMEELLAGSSEKGSSTSILQMFQRGKIREKSSDRRIDRDRQGEGIDSSLPPEIKEYAAIYHATGSASEPKSVDKANDYTFNWLMSLPELSFLIIITKWGEMLPLSIVKRVIERQKTHVLVILLKDMPTVVLKVISLELLHHVLREMSKTDVEEVCNFITAEELTRILQNAPADLVKKIILSLHEVTEGKINKKLKKMSLIRRLQLKIQDGLLELKVMNQGAIEGVSSAVPSLLSLSAGAICRSHVPSIPGNTALVPDCWGHVYIDMVMLACKNMNRELERMLRVSIQSVEAERTPMLIFRKNLVKGDVPQHDVLSLASILPGYDDFIKRVLVARCAKV